MLRVKSGLAICTGALMYIDIGFVPKVFEANVSESSVQGYWDDTMRNGTFCIEHVNELRTDDILLGRHIPQIGTTDTALANTRCTVQFNAAGNVREECTATLAGTAMTAGATFDVVAGGLWACYQLCVTTGSAKTIIPTAALNYATEALAIAAMGTKTINSASLGYITIQSTAGAIWNSTTDCLPGGTTGTPPADGHYYEGYGVMANGVTPYSGVIDNVTASLFNGVIIGISAHLNVLGGRLKWKAYRS